jgi:biopolymer transport protein ExbB
MQNMLIQAFDGPGAIFMYVIAAVMALGIAISIERVWLFWWCWRFAMQPVVDAVQEKNASGALESAGSAPIGPMIQAGMSADSAAHAWDAMGAQAAIAEATVRQRIGALGMVGNLSTMLGLLGTVYGLIVAFSGMSDASAIERNTHLSEGIATAMATTAWGLMVGIPALAAHHTLESKASRILANYQAIAGHIASRFHR